MNEYIDSKELQQMKEQLAILTQKLDKETIVNERLMRQAMKDKASWLRRRFIIKGIANLILLPYFIWLAPGVLGLSIGFCIFVSLFILLALGCDYYINTRFRPEKFVYGNLLEARQDTLMLKKFYANWRKYVGFPFCVIFFAWYIHDISHVLHGDELSNVLIGMAVGVVLGIIAGRFQYRKVQRAIDGILEQIEEMQCSQ